MNFLFLFTKFQFENIHETPESAVIERTNFNLNLRVVNKLTEINAKVTKIEINPRHAKHCTAINQSYNNKNISLIKKT